MESNRNYPKIKDALEKGKETGDREDTCKECPEDSRKQSVIKIRIRVTVL